MGDAKGEGWCAVPLLVSEASSSSSDEDDVDAGELCRE